MTEEVFTDNPNLMLLIPIADALGELCESLVFVGGCATGLLLTSQRAQAIRPTQDVDVVARVTSIGEYYEIEKAMELRGFQHDLLPEAPICRWVKNDVQLDLMPSEPGILGFHNRWYPMAVETMKRVALAGGVEINLVAAPVFIATKFEAFHDRGNVDYLASHDLEDLITVIDGREELIGEIQQSNKELRQYLADEMNKLLELADFQLALPGHLPGDAASQARLPELLGRMREIAAKNRSD